MQFQGKNFSLSCDKHSTCSMHSIENAPHLPNMSRSCIRKEPKVNQLVCSKIFLLCLFANCVFSFSVLHKPLTNSVVCVRIFFIFQERRKKIIEYKISHFGCSLKAISHICGEWFSIPSWISFVMEKSKNL